MTILESGFGVGSKWGRTARLAKSQTIRRWLLAPGFWLKIRYQQSDAGLSIHQGRLEMKMGFEV